MQKRKKLQTKQTKNKQKTTKQSTKLQNKTNYKTKQTTNETKQNKQNTKNKKGEIPLLHLPTTLRQASWVTKGERKEERKIIKKKEELSVGGKDNENSGMARSLFMHVK